MSERLGPLATIATLVIAETFLSACTSPNIQPIASGSAQSAPPVACSVDPLPFRGGPAATYDVDRHETVLFGGLANGASVAGTWLFNGQCWRQAATSTSPSPRFAATLVYDAAVHASLLLGGRNDEPNGHQSVPADAWAWNGQTWTQMTSAPPFVEVAAAYDERRHVVVVTGFSTSTIGTWTWDGANWTYFSSDLPRSVNPTTSAICFDRSNDSIVLFGGWGTGVPINNNTWLWNGNTWTQRHPSHSPTPRFYPVLAGSAHPVLFGGIGGQTGPALEDTWEWDGADWKQLHPTTSPNAVADFGVFDGQLAVIFVATKPSQSWAWTGLNWSRTT